LDSGAKDLNKATLRTYFWALEAYKLFEETLKTTVNAWEQFKRHSLDKVNDSQNPEDYAKSVELIELAIARLQDKIQRIREKSEQVLRLRDGLFYVTSLSDTSVTISQGENIRLLTYFTILFLPLSFSTVSIAHCPRSLTHKQFLF
jgi:Mg2+ and Co2+ transporter CorA